MQFSATWMQLEVIILSEGKTERERKNTIWYHHQLNWYEFKQISEDMEDREPGVLHTMESQRVVHNLVTEQQLTLNLKYDTSEPCLWNRKRIMDIENKWWLPRETGLVERWNESLGLLEVRVYIQNG